MITGIDFEESIQFAKESTKTLGLELFTSCPEDYKGGFFERLPILKGGFPTVRKPWCNRDLKVRPQKRGLNKLLGKGRFYKLVGIRKSESSRRKHMYKAFYNKDHDVASDILVYPLLYWTDDNVLDYLKASGLPTSSLYKKYGVSGCYWCPFYQPSIYRKILRDNPNLYDRFIECEGIYGPSVSGHIYLRDLKAEVLANKEHNI